MKKILFQSDSITDAGRNKEDIKNMGCCYPLLVKAALGSKAPEKHEFINKGISGNRIVDVYAHIKNTSYGF